MGARKNWQSKFRIYEELNNNKKKVPIALGLSVLFSERSELLMNYASRKKHFLEKAFFLKSSSQPVYYKRLILSKTT